MHIPNSLDTVSHSDETVSSILLEVLVDWKMLQGLTGPSVSKLLATRAMLDISIMLYGRRLTTDKDALRAIHILKGSRAWQIRYAVVTARRRRQSCSIKDGQDPLS